MSRHSFRQAAALAVVALAIAAGCSSEKSVQGAVSTLPATSSSAPPDTVVPPATAAPTTAAAPTTVPAESTTTVQGPATTGWTVIDPATAAGPLAFPCCASNWYGETSPALPAPGAALADGVYAIEFAWPTDFTQPVVATVRRFEQCSVLPQGSCEDVGASTYGDDELGVDNTVTFALPLVFDDQLGVVLGGFTGFGGGGFAMATGADIAALVTALDADYQVAIMEPYLAGASQDQIADALIAAPAHGFGAPAEEGAGALVYTHDGAPPLLFQGLTGFDDTPDDTRGSDIIGRISLVVADGHLTINTYAGFYS
ncbi:MAG: hypothetical protein WCC60_06175 [Ilumatobacteraceae bacterium]